MKQPAAPADAQSAAIPEDPSGLIGQVLQMGPEFNGFAEDILLSWVLSLPPDLDPAVAADRLLDRYGIRDGAVPDGAIGRVWRLLREMVQFPETRLRAGSRRQGRRRRSH